MRGLQSSIFGSSAHRRGKCSACMRTMRSSETGEAVFNLCSQQRKQRWRISRQRAGRRFGLYLSRRKLLGIPMSKHRPGEFPNSSKTVCFTNIVTTRIKANYVRYNLIIIISDRIYCGHALHSAQTGSIDMNVGIMLCRGSTARLCPRRGS